MSDPQRLIDDLARLVAFPTVSDRDLTALAAWLSERFEALGFRVERFPDPTQPGKCGLVMTAGPERSDGSGIVLSGHMDVVPTEGQPWTSDPFVLARRGDRLFGRGSADMKGFFAVVLQACARLPIRDLKAPLVLVWTHDEELGCLGSAVLAPQLVGRPLPHRCWIGEPTGFRVLRMHPGHVVAEIVVEGRAAHSSRPRLGLNAIEGAADVVREIRSLVGDLDQDRGPEDPTPRVPINVARIAADGAVNIVPDRCVITLGYRPPPGMSADFVHDRIADRIASLRWDAPIRSRILRSTPSLLTPAGTDLAAIFAADAAPDDDYRGMAPFATDGSNLAALGINPLVFGPGDIEVAHKADEFVEIGSLVRAVDVAERVLRATCWT